MGAGVQSTDAAAVDGKRGSFVNSEPDGRSISFGADPGDESNEPPKPIARREMRVRNDPRQERQMKEIMDHGHCRTVRVRQRGIRIQAAAVHRAISGASENREASAGAAERLAEPDMLVQQASDRRIFPEPDVVRLVAAGDEYAVGTAEDGQYARIARRGSAVELDRLHRSDTADAAVLPKIDFDYPAKASLFYIVDGNLLLVANDEEDPSRTRIVISAQLNKAKGTYDGQIVVDMGGNELQLYNGPVSCRARPS